MPMNHRTMRPYRKSPAGTPASLLLHFDGNFTDSSPSNLVPTESGDVSTSTAESVFGGGSAYFDTGSLSYDDFPAFGGDDFTVEFWFQYGGSASGGGVGNHIVGRHQGGVGADWFICLNDSGSSTGNFIDVYDGTSFQSSSTQPVTAGEWIHVALVRTGSTLRLYAGGVKIVECAAAASYATTFPLTVGASTDGTSWTNCYIDDLRIVKGLAVYDGDFIPPSSARPAIATPYTDYKPYGTFLFSECVFGDLVGTYADGNGGRYTETISTGSC